MNEFQNIEKTSLSQERSLIKISWRYDQELSSGKACHCWMSLKMQW